MQGRNAQRSSHYGAHASATRPASVGGVQELARALSENERRALLERIAKSLSIPDNDRRKIIHGEIRRERRSELIASDMNRLTVWEKLRIWLRRVVTGRADEEIFIRLRLGQAKERVRSYNADLVDFDNRTIRPATAEAVRPVARAAGAVHRFFEVLWQDTDSLRLVLDYLLARRVPDAKRSLNQFCSTEEMQDVFRTTESKNQLKQLILDRVGEYVESIPISVIEEIETGLKPLYLLKDLALFDFDDLFEAFQVTGGDARAEGNEVTFKPAPIPRVLDSLERLYLALYNATRNPRGAGVYPELINYYFAVLNDEVDREDPTSIPESPRLPEMRSQIEALMRGATALKEALPLVDIIRFFREDPYYRFLAYVPKLKLREFYYANLKIELLQELDRRFHDLRMGVLGQLIQETFPNGLAQFEYFHPEIQSAIKRSGVGELRVYRSMQVVQTYMVSVYHGGLLEFLRVMGRLLPGRTRRSGIDFAANIAALDDIADRVREFDRSFSPEADDGKTFYRFRHTSSERDAAQTSAFKALIKQKNRDATLILEKFNDQLRSLYQAGQVIKKGSYSDLNERYRDFESTSASARPFDDRLDRMLHTIENTEKILNQMTRIDREE